MRLAIVLLAAVTAAAEKPAGNPSDDLARVQAEPRPDKRAHAALDNADDALKEAREAYAKGDNAETNARLEEVQQSVELADLSLKATGKNPSRSPKHFKEAELKTRNILRKLDGFREQMSVVDRPALEKVMVVVQKVHDELLDGIMGKRK